jgi:DNA gyrase subunit A
MEKDKIEEDLEALAEEIKYYLSILGSRSNYCKIAKDELTKIRDDFATPRLTSIEEGDFDQDIEDLIQREDMVVTVTHNGYIRACAFGYI